MKRLLLLLLIPLLSGTFVMRADYEAKINDLESRIEVLEQQTEWADTTLVETGDIYEVAYVLENGYITESRLCLIETGECEYGQGLPSEERFLTSDITALRKELQETLASYEAFAKSFGH